MEKVCLVEENMTLALGGMPGAQTVSALASRSVVRGAQSKTLGFARSYPLSFKGGHYQKNKSS